MSNFVVSGRIEADAKSLVAAAKEGAAALDQLKAAESGAAGAAGTLNAETEKATAAERAQAEASRAAAAAAGTHAEAQQRAATAMGLTKNQAQLLRFQLFDVGQSLASGMSPALVLMQQGPQIAQMFNGPREAISGLVSYLGPLRLAIGGVTGAVLAGVLAHESYAASVRQIDVALRGHGERLGLTRDAYLDMAAGIAEAGGVSEREGRLADLYNPDEARAREMSDRQARLTAIKSDPRSTPEMVAEAERGLNGVLREQAELRERIAKRDAPERVRKTQEEIEAERALAAAQRDRARAIEDIGAQTLALLPPYEQAIAKARQWRTQTLADLDATGEGHEEYAARIEAVFNAKVARAYEEDLDRRTDWAAGVARALRDLRRESEDFASIAERGIQDLSGTIKDELIGAALSGEASFERLGDAFARMVLEMAYQKYLASQVEGAVGAVVDLVGGLFGLGGGGGGGWSKITGMLGGRHGGGIEGVDAPSFYRSLPKNHDGWLAPDEELRILRKNEGVFTPRQMDNAGALIAAVASRPIVVQLGDRAQQSAPPAVTVNLHGAPAGTKVEQSRGQDGGLTLDIMMDQMEDRMAGRIAQGRSPINTAIESTYGGTRQVM